MKPVIALSTSYLQNDFPNDGYSMLQEAANLGYEYVELGYSTELTSVEGIMKALGEGIVKVSSLHNFCPLPAFASGSLPNLFSPATRSKMESSQWVRHTKNTIEFAASVGADRFVSHMGALSFFFFPQDAALRSEIDSSGYENLKDSKKYPNILASFKSKATRLSKRQYPNILKNLKEISPLLKEKGIRLGMENRDGFAELPFDLTFEDILSEIEKELAGLVGSWHDVGHSKIKELAGIRTQVELAEKLAPSLIGWHIHDCTNQGKDHRAVGDGDIDFKTLSKFFDVEKHVFVVELSKRVSRQGAADSLKRVQDMMP